MGVPEVVFGLCGLAAGDEVAGLFGDDPGLAERAGSFFALGFRLFHGPAQQCLAGLAVTTGDSGIGGLPQQFEWHGHAVAVEQADRVLAEPERPGGGAIAAGW